MIQMSISSLMSLFVNGLIFIASFLIIFITVLIKLQFSSGIILIGNFRQFLTYEGTYFLEYYIKISKRLCFNISYNIQKVSIIFIFGKSSIFVFILLMHPKWTAAIYFIMAMPLVFINGNSQLLSPFTIAAQLLTVIDHQSVVHLSITVTTPSFGTPNEKTKKLLFPPGILA